MHMTTIRMVDPGRVTGKTRDVFDAVLRREAKVFGATAVSNIWRCQGHVADYLEANWERSRVLMQRGRFTPSSASWSPPPSRWPMPARTESTPTWPP
jgi:hypothetical protein